MNQDLKKKVEELIPNLAKVRRDLHKHPESGWTEFRTASMAIKKMQQLGYTITMGVPLLKVLILNWWPRWKVV